MPTFFDVRTRISIEAVNTLKSYFKDRVLPPIRINTRLREAPGHKKTIFEYAPDSRGSQDYRRMVQAVVEFCDSSQTDTPVEVHMETGPPPQVTSDEEATIGTPSI